MLNFKNFGKGSIVPGYLMIVPNKHVISIANLSLKHKEKFFKLLPYVKKTLEKTFNQPAIFFESGSPFGGTKFVNSIIHAHVQTTPLRISKENMKLMKEQMFLEPFDYQKDLSSLKNKSYSFLIDSNNNGFASTSLERPRQIFRKIIAERNK